MRVQQLQSAAYDWLLGVERRKLDQLEESVRACVGANVECLLRCSDGVVVISGLNLLDLYSGIGWAKEQRRHATNWQREGF